MDPPQRLVHGQRRHQARDGADGPQEVDPGAEPLRCERMLRAEVVGERALTEDEERAIDGAAGHVGHDTAMERTYTTPRLDKLGVRPGARVALVDLQDDAFEAELRERTADVIHGEPPRDTDLVFLAADGHAALEGLVALRSRIRPAGAIWVVSRKGKTATLRDVEVIAAARAAGLVDNKVARFDADRTALRLVIPVAMRPHP
jgi:hypothetical protein